MFFLYMYIYLFFEFYLQIEMNVVYLKTICREAYYSVSQKPLVRIFFAIKRPYSYE